jgi:superfamily II DNA or RNA helicase
MGLFLHDFQADLVSRVRAAFKAGAKRVVMQLSCGGGKTATASEILRATLARGRRAVFLAHLDTLIEDTHARLERVGINAGYVQAGRPSDPTAPVQICSLATLHSRGELPPADLVVLDECHRAMAATVRPILEAYGQAHHLGLSATPQRGSDGQPLGDVYERMVCGPSNRWLTDHGYLVPCHVLAPGAYVEEGLCADPLEAYRTHVPGQRALIFATNVEHAEKIVASFANTFWTAALLTGDTPRAERQDLRRRLENGQLDVLVGVGVFIEGWDAPSVEAVILARAFTVTGSYLQAIGRGLRTSPGKKRCTVIDLRGAVNLQGLPDEDRTWSLDGAAVRRTEPMTALARCKQCMAVFRQAAVCPRCGARADAVARVPRVLSRAEKLEKWSHLPQASRDARYVAQLVRVARDRIGMPEHRAQEWALKKFRAKWGRDPEECAA